MVAITSNQLRALLADAPGNARISAVQDAKRLVAQELRAVSRFIESARSSNWQPRRTDYMLLAWWNEIDQSLKEVEFAMGVGIPDDVASSLGRLRTLLQRPAPPQEPVCVGCGVRGGAELVQPGRAQWRALGKLVRGPRAPAMVCPECQERDYGAPLFDLENGV